jgi:hypothetical protein
VDRLGQERRRVVDVGTERLRDRDDLDTQLRPQQLLVALGLNRVPREPRRVEDEDGLELPGHRVLDEPLKAGALIRGTAGLEVEIFIYEAETVVLGVAGDGLPLAVRREALALLLG